MKRVLSIVISTALEGRKSTDLDALTVLISYICERLYRHRHKTRGVTNRIYGRFITYIFVRYSGIYNFPVDIQDKILDLFGGVPLRENCYNKLKHGLSAASLELMSCRQWLLLHEISCFHGKFTLGQIAREKARLLAIRPLERLDFAPPINWEHTISAAIEGGECSCLTDLNILLKRARLPEWKSLKWRLYVKAVNGTCVDPKLLKVLDTSGYRDFLANKSIALVGPALTSTADAEDIDRHDIVIRLNHTHSLKGTDPNIKGTRTDITYLNGSQSRSMITNQTGLLPAELTWGCFKSTQVLNKVEKAVDGQYNRPIIAFDDIQFHGKFNMIPITVLDLIVCGAKRVKVFHTDLMLTSMRQKHYYPKNFSPKFNDKIGMKKVFKRSSVIHDPIQQYKVLKKLWINKKVIGDARFNDVMEIGLESYLQRLEFQYAE